MREKLEFVAGAVLALAGALSLAGHVEAEELDSLLVHGPRDGGRIEDSPRGTTIAVRSPEGGEPRLLTFAPATADAVDVIVELRSPSVARRGRLRNAQDRASVRTELGNEHARVVAEILRLEGAHARSGHSPIRRELETTFNGIATTLSSASIAALRNHPDVAAIHPDKKVKAVLDSSVPVIQAPAFWASHGGFRGAGQVIAIIDTGVDYTHPDLGGCAQPGPACKVIGGHDFVNDDEDPLDDQGHGTHVAAIAAGDGALVGVAPDASLLAYKVLDAAGSGEISSVIAALDAAADPNGDLDTSDHADVVNLSLGYPDGGPDSPDAQAVDAASATGIAVVAAAGNDFSYFSIGSPGVARTAITVGAVTDSLVGTTFTSRGPVAETFDIKPDLSAPGYQICAARGDGTSLGGECLDQEHVILSGTSMAAPHVAGAAALLRGILPTLSPADIKSLLANSGAASTNEFLQSGASTLDVQKSSAAHTVVSPQSLGFGVSDRSVAIWQPSRTLTVRNIGNTSRSYTMSATGHYVGMPAGAGVSFTPSTFSLGAGQSRTVQVNLTVDNTLVPDRPTPYGYEAMVLVTSSGEEQRVPLLFLKTSYLRVHTDRLATSIYAHSHRVSRDEPFVAPNGTATTLLMPSGTYDVIVHFDGIGRQVVHENVVLNGFADETISSAEAVYTVTLIGRNEINQPLTHTNRAITLFYQDTDAGLMAVTSNVEQPFILRSNALSSNYNLGLAAVTSVGNHTYFISRGTTGLSGNQNLDNTPSELTRSDLRTYLNPGEEPLEVFPFLTALFDSGGFGKARGAVSPADREIWMTPSPRPNSRIFLEPFVHTPATDYEYRNAPSYRGGTTIDEIEALHAGDIRTPVYRTTTGEMPLDLGPASFFLRIYRAGAYGRLDPLIGRQWWSFLFPGGDGPNAETGYVAYELADSTRTQTGNLPQWGAGADDATALDLTVAGEYELNTEPLAYPMAGLPATVRARLTFDTSNPGDGEPPWLRRVEVRTGGMLAEEIPLGQSATVRIEGGDGVDSSVSVALFRVNGAVESSITLTPIGAGVFEATIPCSANGGVPTVITVTDDAGNTLRQENAPLFVCGVSVCGDGAIGPAETCDDGNVASGDCCSASCQLESDGSSCTDGVFCNGADQCASGHCTLHAGNPCSTRGPCANVCNEAGDTCNLAYGTACPDDGSICSSDVCDGSGSCTHVSGFFGAICRPAVNDCDVPEFCDSTSDCPLDTGSGDSDGDGTCDGLDVCTNPAGQQNMVTPPTQLKLGGVFRDIATGNDRLSLSGFVVLPRLPDFALLDLGTTGARVVLRNAMGTSIADVVLSTGAFEKATARGWTYSSNKQRWTYKDKSASPPAGIDSFAVTFDLADNAGPSARIKLRARGGTFPVTGSDSPINLAVTFGNNVEAAAGICAESVFVGADCEWNSSETGLRCRR